MATNYSPKIVTDGLVLCLDAANPKSYPGSGTTWTDLSKNGNDGTLVNGVGYSSDNKGALTFDGTNDSVNLSESSIIKNLTTNFTISAFVKFVTSGGQYAIFTKGDDYGDGWTLYLRQGPQFSFIGFSTNNVSSGIIPTPSGQISENVWYNVVYTYNGSTVIGYVNGEQKASKTLSSFVFNDTGTIPKVGSDPVLASPTIWSGNISNIQLYNRALTADEIKQNFAATRGRYGI